MTTATLTTAGAIDPYPLLVSELPPLSAIARSATRGPGRRAVRREQLRLERVLREAGPQERTDLLHALRRD